MHGLKKITLNQQVNKNNWREKLRVREETIRTWTPPSPESEGARIATVRDRSTLKKTAIYSATYISNCVISIAHLHILFSSVSCYLQCHNHDTWKIKGDDDSTISVIPLYKIIIIILFNHLMLNINLFVFNTDSRLERVGTRDCSSSRIHE